MEIFLCQEGFRGIEPADTRLKLSPGAAALAKAEDLLLKHGLMSGDYALIYPASPWMFKPWTPAGSARVVEHLRRIVVVSKGFVHSSRSYDIRWSIIHGGMQPMAVVALKPRQESSLPARLITRKLEYRPILCGWSG